jgi:hypothetical protein
LVNRLTRPGLRDCATQFPNRYRRHDEDLVGRRLRSYDPDRFDGTVLRRRWNAYANTDRNGNCDGNGNGNSNGYCDGDTNGYCNTYANSDCNCDCYGNAYANSDCNGYCHRIANGDTATGNSNYANTASSPDATASSIAL